MEKESLPEEEMLTEAGTPVSENSDTEWIIRRPKRGKLTAEESLKRMQAFSERKEQFIASVRKSKS